MDQGRRGLQRFNGSTAVKMHVDFLGKGWSFPVAVTDDKAHRFVMVEEEESIRQAIWIILATAPGERAMRPDFGCGIHRLVFEVNTATTAGQVSQEVRQALVLWEPRIDVLDVDVGTRGHGELLLINVHYRVRSTNNLFNLVYPFYLARGSS